MNADGLRRFREVGLAAVLEAGPIALECFRRDVAVEDKRNDGAYDPVTEADRQIEELIRDRLLQSFPQHCVVGEESGTVGDGTYCWFIDPIDGTRSFISGMPTWGILLGLVVAGRPSIGIMHQPFTGETWLADTADGSRLLHHGVERPLRARDGARLEDAVLYSTHPSMFREPALLQRYARLAERCRLQRWGGDCYAFALLALGCIDVMVDSSLMPYDILPLVPIIEGAGGIVTDLHGRVPLEGGTVIAAANARLHSTVLGIMTGEA